MDAPLPESASAPPPSPGRPSAPSIATPAVEFLSRLVAALLLLALGWIVLRSMAVVLAPILVSFLIAYLLDPLIDRFEAKRVSRTAAIVVVSTAALLLITLFVVVIIPSVARQAGDALHRAPEWADRTYERVQGLVYEQLGLSQEQVREAIMNAVRQAQTMLGGVVRATIESAGSLANAILIPVFVFYFLRDFDELKKKPLLLIPERYHPQIIDRARRMDSVVGSWVRGQVQVACILALLYGTGLALAGIPFGFLIGVVAGLLNVVPYFGAFVGIGLSILMALLNAGGLAQIVWVLVVFVVVQLLEGYVITPRLVGEKVGMGPVTVMIVLFVGGSVFGFLGLLLSIPAVAAGSVLAEDLLERYRDTRFWKGASPAETTHVAGAQPVASAECERRDGAADASPSSSEQAAEGAPPPAPEPESPNEPAPATGPAHGASDGRSSRQDAVNPVASDAAGDGGGGVAQKDGPHSDRSTD